MPQDAGACKLGPEVGTTRGVAYAAGLRGQRCVRAREPRVRDYGVSLWTTGGSKGTRRLGRTSLKVTAQAIAGYSAEPR